MLNILLKPLPNPPLEIRGGKQKPKLPSMKAPPPVKGEVGRGKMH